MELQEALDKFMRKKRIERIAPESLKNYEYNLSTFKHFYNGWIDELTEDDIDDYILYLQEGTELKLTTINNKIRDLRAFLNYCYKQGIIPNRFEIKLLRINEPDIIPFEEYQLKAIYDACLNVDNGQINYLGKGMCHRRDYTLMRMLEETGMRIGETLRLDINDVNLKRNTIQLRQTKNGKSRQTYITAALHKEIKLYLEVRQDFLYDKNLAATSFFINREGGRLCSKTIQEKIADYGRLAGVTNARCSPHTFRHTFAKNYLLNGGDVFTLKDILGHSSLDMTYRYARLFGIEQQTQYTKVMERYSRSKKSMC
jgi:integrase/recombinase XerD